MSAQILDGRTVSQSILESVGRDVKNLKGKGILPKLVIILVGENPASLSYVSQKEKASNSTGILCDLVKLSEKETTTESLVSLIEKLNDDKTVHGILVQLPLPPKISVSLVTRAIDPAKDVDGFHAYNIGKMFISCEFERLVPCTPAGVIKLLEYYKLPIAGQNIVIVGRSNLVGKPLAAMLINRSATVTVCNSKTKNLGKFTSEADVLISAVGKPKLITKDMVKAGAVLIDVGTVKFENKLVGDMDSENLKEIASYISPVPGGVGPMTVACLMENVLASATPTSNNQ